MVFSCVSRTLQCYEEVIVLIALPVPMLTQFFSHLFVMSFLLYSLFSDVLLEPVLGSFLVALGAQSTQKVSKGRSFSTTFGDFLVVWPKSEILSLAAATARY